MDAPKDRLQKARNDAGYESPSAAAAALRINKHTLISHENGNRAISRKAAEKYGELFKVDPGWLLFGELGEPSGLIDDIEEVISFLKRVNWSSPHYLETVIGVVEIGIKTPDKSKPVVDHAESSPQKIPHASRP